MQKWFFLEASIHRLRAVALFWPSQASASESRVAVCLCPGRLQELPELPLLPLWAALFPRGCGRHCCHFRLINNLMINNVCVYFLPERSVKSSWLWPGSQHGLVTGWEGHSQAWCWSSAQTREHGLKIAQHECAVCSAAAGRGRAAPPDTPSPCKAECWSLSCFPRDKRHMVVHMVAW